MLAAFPRRDELGEVQNVRHGQAFPSGDRSLTQDLVYGMNFVPNVAFYLDTNDVSLRHQKLEGR